jgi:dTDP-4-amino-4,6-dideoxygalactose transaminase
MVDKFEETFAEGVGTKYAVAVSNGTAALHASMFALDIGPGDEVIVPTMTFAATANAVVFQGGKPIFADVHPETLLLSPEEVESKLSPRTKAIVAVDFTGHPCDYDLLREITEERGLALVADACHALGGVYKGRRVGSLADLNTFSFHPVKPITSGEGGMITTDDQCLVERMRLFRNHGIETDFKTRADRVTWFYEMIELGYNYRLTDIQCALGMSQLKKLSSWVERRREIAAEYDETVDSVDEIDSLSVSVEVDHAYHLYVVRLNERASFSRSDLFTALRNRGIGVNVHYIPVHLHAYYRTNFGTGMGLCPVAEDAYERMLSVPLFPAMSDRDVDRVKTGLLLSVEECM